MKIEMVQDSRSEIFDKILRFLPEWFGIESYHRKNAGRLLVSAAERFLSEGNFKYLTVKTLSENLTENMLFLEPSMDFFGKYLEVTPSSRLIWTNEEGGKGAAEPADERKVNPSLKFH